MNSIGMESINVFFTRLQVWQILRCASSSASHEPINVFTFSSHNMAILKFFASCFFVVAYTIVDRLNEKLVHEDELVPVQLQFIDMKYLLILSYLRSKYWAVA